MTKPKTQSKKTPPAPGVKSTPPAPAKSKNDPHADKVPRAVSGKLSWEIISNSLAKQANGEVLRWRYNEANGELIVLLVDGRKFHSFFEVPHAVSGGEVPRALSGIKS